MVVLSDNTITRGFLIAGTGQWWFMQISVFLTQILAAGNIYGMWGKLKLFNHTTLIIIVMIE